MDLTSVFIQNLKILRKGKGFSQNALAEKADISGSMIARIETKSVHPSFDTIEKLANALDVEPFELFMDNYGKSLLQNKSMKGIVDEISEILDYYSGERPSKN